MMGLIKLSCCLFLMLFVFGCGAPSEKKDISKPAIYGSYKSNVTAMVDVYTADHYTRRLKNGYGFYVAPDVVVAPLSLVKGAYRVKISPTGTSQMFPVKGYTAYDLNRNLVALKVQRKNNNFIKRYRFSDVPSDTLYTLFRKSRQLMVNKTKIDSLVQSDSVSYYAVEASLESGKPAFFLQHALAGMVLNDDGSSFRVIDACWIDTLLAHQLKQPKPVIDLSGKTNKVYPSYKTIQGFRIVTDQGAIVIRLYDDTPLYRDNFIKLVADQFYDSLLVHRVLRGFLIQTGAADSRYALPEDIVGWQGPGYTLPMKVVPGIFHKRGAVAASKLPDARNPRNTSDGSQFYIVSGRPFTDDELDDLEQEKGITYTAEQRRVYTTVGGAPYLDNDYTVFGEVVSGMSVVDRISMAQTDADDRPVDDIRIIRVEMIRK
ncbi:peptidylprolyl isomerase [Geofilum sp. OHC36d9]|uniref:peptidylprolyl isomerase n=1 Tax=Geofilum sp. OHC36d9 TaxID=3458413 RepID=UPI00403389FB